MCDGWYLWKYLDVIGHGSWCSRKVQVILSEPLYVLRQVGREARRVGGRKPKLDEAQRRGIIDNVLSGRRRAADMARLFNVDPATVCRLVAKARSSLSLAPVE